MSHSCKNDRGSHIQAGVDVLFSNLKQLAQEENGEKRKRELKNKFNNVINLFET